METKEMLTCASPGVNTVAGSPIKHASIIRIHFLSAVCVRRGQKKANTVTAWIQTLMVWAPRVECNYGFSAVSLTVMHADMTALWPCLCPTRRVFWWSNLVGSPPHPLLFLLKSPPCTASVWHVSGISVQSVILKKSLVLKIQLSRNASFPKDTTRPRTLYHPFNLIIHMDKKKWQTRSQT